MIVGRSLLVDLADMLVADDAAAIDDEGLGDAGRADVHLHPPVDVGADRAERIAVIGEEDGEILGPVANRDADHGHAAAGERLELRRLDPAGQAPAGEDVDDLRLALAERRRRRGPGAPAMAGARVNSGSGWPISPEWTALSRGA